MSIFLFGSFCSKSMQFTTFSGSEISKMAEVQVYKGLYYDTTRKPIEGGLLDPRMVQLLSYILMGDWRFMFIKFSFFYLFFLLSIIINNYGLNLAAVFDYHN